MNPYPAHLMPPLERRAALCAILALGMVRLRMKRSSKVSANIGDSSLHSPTSRSGHATATDRRTA